MTETTCSSLAFSFTLTPKKYVRPDTAVSHGAFTPGEPQSSDESWWGSCWAVQVSKGAGRQFAERLAIKFDRKSVVYPEISLLSSHHYDPRHAPWWSR